MWVQVPPYPQLKYINNMIRKKFTHDCNKCNYLGSDDQHDYYYCSYNKPIPTVIARFGNINSEYCSGLKIAQILEQDGVNDPLVIALKLARSHGFI